MCAEQSNPLVEGKRHSTLPTWQTPSLCVCHAARLLRGSVYVHLEAYLCICMCVCRVCVFAHVHIPGPAWTRQAWRIFGKDGCVRVCAIFCEVAMLTNICFWLSTMDFNVCTGIFAFPLWALEEALKWHLHQGLCHSALRNNQNPNYGGMSRPLQPDDGSSFLLSASPHRIWLSPARRCYTTSGFAHNKYIYIYIKTKQKRHKQIRRFSW